MDLTTRSGSWDFGGGILKEGPRAGMSQELSELGNHPLDDDS